MFAPEPIRVIRYPQAELEARVRQVTDREGATSTAVLELERHVAELAAKEVCPFTAVDYRDNFMEYAALSGPHFLP